MSRRSFASDVRLPGKPIRLLLAIAGVSLVVISDGFATGSTVFGGGVAALAFLTGVATVVVAAWPRWPMFASVTGAITGALCVMRASIIILEPTMRPNVTNVALRAALWVALGSFAAIAWSGVIVPVITLAARGRKARAEH